MFRRVFAVVAALAGLSLSSAGVRAQAAGPLQLRDAVAEALQHSPELGASEDAVVSADLQRREAAGAFGVHVSPNLSSFSGQGGYDTRTMGFTVAKMLTTGTDVWVSGSTIAFGGIGGQENDRGYSVGVSQPLTGLLSHAVTAPLDAATHAAASAQRRLTAARQQLVVSVAEAYYGVLAAERLHEAALGARDRAHALVEASEARAKAGLDTQLDVMRARLLASQADATLGDREESLASSRERLNVLLGRPADGDVVIAAGGLSQAPAAAADAAGAIDTALALRVEVQDTRARIEDAKRAFSVAHWNLAPPLALNMEYVQRGLGTSLQALYRPYNGWHLSVTSNFSFDRTTAAAALAQSELAVRAAERDARDVEQRIQVEVRQASRAVAKADQQAAIQAQARDIAVQQVELAKLRYERGLADNLTVVDAETALALAEASCISAEIDRHLARLRLQRAEGTLDPANPPS